MWKGEKNLSPEFLEGAPPPATGLRHTQITTDYSSNNVGAGEKHLNVGTFDLLEDYVLGGLMQEFVTMGVGVSSLDLHAKRGSSFAPNLKSLHRGPNVGFTYSTPATCNNRICDGASENESYGSENRFWDFMSVR